jgi:glycosyltransferase involved in cell wall biosynthesis
MQILINMKLGDSKVDAKLRPLAQLECVDRLLVVRDYPGPDLPKVCYYCPPRFIARLAAVSAMHKLLILIYLSLIEKPDLIHAYLLFPHGILAFIAAKLTGIPIGISLIAGPIELYAIGSPVGLKFPRPLPWYGKVFLRILGQCDIVTTTGSFTRDFLISHGISSNHVYILPHSANAQKYQPTIVPKIYDVISIGRLASIKHTEVLLKAISIVKQQYQEVKVGIVGDGPCRTYLEKLRDELGICNNVEFLGFQKEVTHYYNSGKIFVLTSEREGFPGAFVEAMMCGIPSVVANCGDIVDIAVDGYNAIVIQDYNDVEAFANAIIRLLQDNELYQRLSLNALGTVKRLSVAEVTREWGMILDSVICNKKKSP